MIKVFATAKHPKEAADELTQMCNDWIALNPMIEIKNIDSNSNNFGWMLVIHYEEIHSEAD
jgi:hypothetical protein